MIIWKSELTSEMVSDLPESEIEQLIGNLNDAVFEIVTSFGVK